MITEHGAVVQSDEKYIWVETQVTAACDACNAKSNCGTSSVAKAFSNKTVINKVENTLNASVDDRVEIGIPEQSLITGAFLVYILPLVTALITATIVQFWLVQFIPVYEWQVILASSIGGFLGFKLSKRFIDNDKNQQFEPVLLKVLSSPIPVKNVTN